MYAAAGGASLASRQARQRQRQNKKAAAQRASKASDLLPKPPQKGQFYNYTDETVPRLARPPPTLKPPAQANERRHSTSNYNNKEPRARIKESPSICLPVHPSHGHCHGLSSHHVHHVHGHAPPSVQSPPSPTTSHQLPQIPIPEGDKSLDRRCSFVRQVEEEKDGEKGVLDRCHHMCNFEIKEKQWDHHDPGFYTEYDLFGSLDYPFSEQHLLLHPSRDEVATCWMSTAASAGMQAALLIREKQRLRKKRRRTDLPSHVATREIAPFPQYPPGFTCSQGRAAWQERERGRRGSLSDEARQHRLKQNEAHHRWMKRNRIHDTTYGGSSEEEDFFDVYHQSAAANALLYVGLGTIAIGAVIFFVGTGEKGFKTLELRLIGPTLVAGGLLCCLVRVLLCACPSTCLRARKKTRLKNGGGGGGSVHQHGATSRCPLTRDRSADRRTTHVSTCFEKHKKKVSIVTSSNNTNPVASTSTNHFQDADQTTALIQVQADAATTLLPIISVPEDEDDAAVAMGLPREDSLIELERLDANVYDLQSISSYESETVIEIESRPKESKLTRAREPARHHHRQDDDDVDAGASTSGAPHSGIVLSPLQLGQ